MGAAARSVSLSAYMLHSHEWSESSLIVDLLTRERGRLAVVAKGARRPYSQLRAVLLPFQRISVTLAKTSPEEASDLFTLRQAEWLGGHAPLSGSALFAGFYLHELRTKSLARLDPHPALFDAYAMTLPALVGGDDPRAQILASGVAVNWALEAQQILRRDWSVETDVWSVTSWNELRRDGLDTDRWNLLNPLEPQRVAYVTQRLEGRGGPVVGVSDWMRTVQDQIGPWVPGDYVTLGTDGWGLSDTRGALRRYFLVDAESIVVRLLTALADRGEIEREALAKAIDRYELLDPSAADAGNTEGSG